MGDLSVLAEQMIVAEEPLLDSYEAMARQAMTETERRLTAQMIRAQQFQMAALRLVADKMVPERFHCFGIITHNDVKIRQGPSPRHGEVARLNQGAAVVVEELQGNWARLQLADGAPGWVFKDYVHCELTG